MGYLKGYGRHFGEKLSYSTGVAYGSSLLVGGTYGLILGLRQGGATSKLRTNAVLNAVSAKGPMLANQCATITMFYVLSNQLVGWARRSDDEANAIVSGAFAGALYKCTSPWKMLARYSAASTLTFAAIDTTLRRGLI